jgi:hypothetical protein
LVAVGLGGLLLAWLALKAAVAAGGIGHVPAVAGLRSGHPEVDLRRAAEAAQNMRGALPPAVQARVERAARAAPLAEEPFLIAGLRALDGGDSDRAAALIDEALRRNPRSRPARLALIDLHARAGRTEAAAVQLAALNRLVPEAGTLLVPELARMVRDPRTRGQARAMLLSDPLLDQVLGHLVRNGADPALVMEFHQARAVPQDETTAAWQNELLARLTERGRHAQTLAVWRGMAGGSDHDGSRIYDPDFTGRPGPPPFNWAYGEGNLGAAERGGGALEVVYYGRDSGALTRQLLLLPPGRYRLAVEGEGDATGQGSRMFWRLVCAAGDAVLAELPVEGLSGAPKRFAANATVPANCPAQWLRLDGEAAEFPTRQTAAFRQLRLERAN